MQNFCYRNANTLNNENFKESLGPGKTIKIHPFMSLTRRLRLRDPLGPHSSQARTQDTRHRGGSLHTTNRPLILRVPQTHHFTHRRVTPNFTV